MAVDHELSDAEVLQIRDIISILSTVAISIGYISEEEGESGAVYVSAGQVRQYRALNEFLTHHVRSARHLYVSGTLLEPHNGYFSELSGKEVRNTIFPDFREATKKLTLVPDRWKLASWNFKQKLPTILETIKAIAEREKQSIYLLAPNGRKAKIIRDKLKKAGLKGVLVDYYRSDRSMGVERKERVCISIGLAEVPANACDALAHGKNSEERWLDSRKLRRQGVDAATWQATNRVRDPDGLTESKIYFIGSRLDRIRDVATWGTNRTLRLKEIKETKSSTEETIRTPIFEVLVDQELELPRIQGEDKGTTHSYKRAASDLIKQIEVYNNDLINSEKHALLSTNIYRGKGAEFRIYNIPTNTITLDLTSSLLYLMFANRTDCYAKQYFDFMRRRLACPACLQRGVPPPFDRVGTI